MNCRPNALVAFVLAANLALLPNSGSAAPRKAKPAATSATSATSTAAADFDRAASDYRQGIQDLAEGDEDARIQVDESLAQMKLVMDRCGQERGCDLGTLTSRYTELLRFSAASAAGDEVIGEDEENQGEGVSRAINPSLAGEGTQRAAADLLSERRAKFAEMVQFNPAIQAGIRKWLTDMRPSLMNSYENYQYMRQYVAPAAEQYGLPEALMFGIMAKESNGKVHVSSRAGAAGPFQFMPATGRRFGLGNDGTGFDTRFDPRASSQAAAEYLAERMGELNRSIELALAAYNGGEGRALRVYNASAGASFWNESVYNQFPAETKDYVPMVIAAAWIYLHPREYGVYFPRVSARPTTFRVDRPTSLYELTMCLGNRGSRDGYFRALRNLNPRWEADSTIPAGSVLNGTTRIASLYRSYCNSGRRAELTQQLMKSQVRNAIVRVGNFKTVETGGVAVANDSGAAAVPATPTTYSVQTGETLTSVSRKFGCAVSQLASANALSATSPLRVGQKLDITVCKDR